MSVPSPREPAQAAPAARKYRAALLLGAVGVVYGDIGTSPLYTLKEAFGVYGLPPTEENVLGVLSLVVWALVLVVSVKYAGYIMRADNRGEGGIMALTALAQRSVPGHPRLRGLIVLLGLFGAALFFGDGVITPAISVLSAVEGVQIAAPGLAAGVVPLTVLIIIALFMLQKYGSGRVGRVFGPIMVVWFVVIALLGLVQLVQQPQVLSALSPHHAVRFFMINGWLAVLALGAVVLCITGAEALYADMGHFGKGPIRLSWFGFVLPALLLNYFGQGALLLTDASAAQNPFYLLVPEMLLYPMIGLATVATVIASQSVISGAFSVTRAAVQLGYLPRMQVRHTSEETIGQIYLPWVSRMLMLLTVAVVIGFGSSSNLAAAYGIAVVGTMTIDTLLVMVVFRGRWHWRWPKIVALGGLFLLVDLGFLGANIGKIAHGGWFPLVLGGVLFLLMGTWRRGRELVTRQLRQAGLAMTSFLVSIGEHPPLRVAGTAIFLTPGGENVPQALLHNLKHNKVLHERNVLLSVVTLDRPRAELHERVSVVPLVPGFYRVVLRFGFSEDPDVPRRLQDVDACGAPFDMMDATFFVSRESIVALGQVGMPLWRDRLFAFMQRNSLPATAFFRIPGNRMVELGSQVEI